MNINVTEFRTVNGPGYEHLAGYETLAEQIQEHVEIMGRSGRWTLTGRVALISPVDLELSNLGVLQVWSETAEGVWVWVSPTGQAVETVLPQEAR